MLALSINGWLVGWLAGWCWRQSVDLSSHRYTSVRCQAAFTSPHVTCWPHVADHDHAVSVLLASPRMQTDFTDSFHLAIHFICLLPTFLRLCCVPRTRLHAHVDICIGGGERYSRPCARWLPTSMIDGHNQSPSLPHHSPSITVASWSDFSQPISNRIVTGSTHLIYNTSSFLDFCEWADLY